MSIFINLTAGLVILAALFGLLHLLWGSGSQKFFRRQFFTDVLWWYFRFTVVEVAGRVVIGVPFAVVGVLLGFSLDELGRGAYAGFGPVAHWPPWLQIAAFLLLFDLALYWNHRLFHTRRWWRFHALHHSPEQLDWLSAIRVHPINELFGNLTSVLPVLLVGFNPKWVVPFALPAGLYALFVHADLNWSYGPLRLVIASPVFHRWHHSREREAWDKNFAALFPVWDVIFGTLYFPKDRHPENFGIDEKMPDRFWSQLTYPFRGSKPVKATAAAPGDSTAAINRV